MKTWTKAHKATSEYATKVVDKYGSPRDSQKARLYKADDIINTFGGQGIDKLGRAKAQAFVDNLMSHAWIKRHYEVTRIHVENRRGGGGVAYPWQRLIILGNHSDYSTLLHEVAHVLDYYCRHPECRDDEFNYHWDCKGKGSWHGWHFAATLLRLVQHIHGKKTMETLRWSYRFEKVRYTPPRPKKELTAEQREVLRERMANAREARAASKSLPTKDA